MKKVIRIIINLIFFTCIGFYLWYNYNAGLIFTKAISYEKNSNFNTSILAHEILIVKYRYSPISTLSRIITNKNLNPVEAKHQIEYTPYFYLERIPFFKNLNPYNNDFFSFLCLLFSGLLLLYLIDFVSIRTRILTTKKKFILISIYLFYLIIISYLITKPVDIQIYNTEIDLENIWNYIVPSLSSFILLIFFINLFKGEKKYQ